MNYEVLFMANWICRVHNVFGECDNEKDIQGIPI